MTQLESRLLLAFSATWIGQDGHDYVGQVNANLPAPNDYQDIHIQLTGLSQNSSNVVSVQLSRFGGGEGWAYNAGSPGTAYFIPNGPSSGDLYVDADKADPPNTWFDNLTVTYSGGGQDSYNQLHSGSTANLNLRDVGRQLSAQWLGQDGKDWTGPSASPGPDGIQDFHLQLANLSDGGVDVATAIQSVLVIANPGTPQQLAWEAGINSDFEWPTGSTPSKVSDAELTGWSQGGNGLWSVDLYANPVTNQNGGAALPSNAPMEARVVYVDQARHLKIDTVSFTGGTVNAQLSMNYGAVGNLGTVTAHSTPQDGAYPGNSHAVFDNLNGHALNAVTQAVLSDEAGGTWVYPNTGNVPYTNEQDYYTNNPNPQGQGTGETLNYDSKTGTFSYVPLRSEAGATMTLHVFFSDGPPAVARFAGAAADLTLRAVKPPTSAALVPGNLLASTIAGAGGPLNLHLTADGTGNKTFTFTTPITINYPTTITADPGITIQFAPSPGAPWGGSGAFNIAASNVTLSGFAIAILGTSASWSNSTDFNSPDAVIRLTGPGPGDLVGLAFTYLNITGPAAWSPGEQAVNLLTTNGRNDSGLIDHDTFLGGDFFLQGGPWTITNNTYYGPPANTQVDHVFSIESERDVRIQSNTFTLQQSTAQVHRVIAMGGGELGRGYNDVFDSNTITGGIGEKGGGGSNEPELILTEGYVPHFEGTAFSVSPDGYVLQIPQVRGIASSGGDIVSVLSGPNAGQYFMIAQALSATQYLMDKPLPSGSYAIEISRGWVNDSYTNNTIDLRTVNSTDVSLDLQGDQFGTAIKGNTFKGAQVLLTAIETQSSQGIGGQNFPPQGWSHVPFLGLDFESNTFLDTNVFLQVWHGADIKANNDRRYFAGTFSNNGFTWDTAGQPVYDVGVPATTNQPDPSRQEPNYTHANFPWLDDGEIDLTFQGNWGVGGPDSNHQTAAVVSVFAATFEPGAVAKDGTTVTLPTTGTTVTAPNLTATASANPGEIDISWNAISGATGYVLQRSPDNTNWTQIATPGGSATSYQDTGLPASTTYYYRIDVTTAGGISPFSAVASATTAAPVTPPSAATLGQDGNDFIGSGSNSSGPDGYQDLHFVLSGLSSTAAVSYVDIQGFGGGEWQYNGSGTDKIVVRQTPGATTADLFLQPYQAETGRYFSISLKYTGSNTTVSGIVIAHVYADARLAPPTAASLGQDGNDYIGSGSNSAGPDGYQDIHVALAGIPSYKTISYINILGNGGGKWQYDGSGSDKAVLVRAASSNVADLFLSPYQDETGRFYTVAVTFSDGTTATPPGNVEPVTGVYADSHLPMPTVPFSDPLTSTTLGAAWTRVAGTWTPDGSEVKQTDTSGASGKKLNVTAPSYFPTAVQIVSRVRVDSGVGPDDARVGVGLFTDGSGNGYNLVFHGTNQIQLLNDGVAWSNPVSYTWSRSTTWYWFKLLVVKDLTNNQDALYGKVWQDGTNEPVAWTIQQTGWSRANGAPSLNGGSNGAATASFNSVTVTTPVIFHDDFNTTTVSPSWTTVAGTWSEDGSEVMQTNAGNIVGKKLTVNTPTTFPTTVQILAKVRVDSGVGPDDARVGVGLFTDSTGKGYNLVFHGTNQVQLLDDGLYWSNPVSFNWSRSTWYWFELRVIKDPSSGQDTLYGLVWPDGSPRPTSWTIQQTGWTHANGAPSLNGGSEGAATASFDDVSVTMYAPTGSTSPSLAVARHPVDPADGFTGTPMPLSVALEEIDSPAARWVVVPDSGGMWRSRSHDLSVRGALLRPRSIFVD